MLVFVLGAWTLAIPAAAHTQSPQVAQARPLARGETRLAGQIVDYSCYLQQGLPSTSEAHRECARECLNKGNPVGLLGRNKVLYLLVAPPRKSLASLLRVEPGEAVEVTGRLKKTSAGTTLEVHEGHATEAHSDHEADHGGQLGMTGDYHIELVERHDGSFRVYLSDMNRRPIPSKELTGRIVATMEDGTEKQVSLAADPSGWYLASRKVSPKAKEVTVRLARGKDESLYMTFETSGSSSHTAPEPGSKTENQTMTVSGMSAYDKIRRSLTRDSLVDVPQNAGVLESEMRAVSGSGTGAEDVAKAANQLAATSSLDGARTSFKAVSDAYIRFLAQTKTTQGVVRFHCPMANADWVQTNNQTTNPYYGSSMLRCGTAVPWEERATK